MPTSRPKLRSTASRPKTNGEGIPVVAIDIDGTLGDYHSWFLKFAEMWAGKPMPSADEINDQPFWKFMRLTRRDYRDCKLAYRQGGYKRGMPVYEGSAELTRKVRASGAEVWICSTRPYLRLDNIDPDTREWLRRNGIEYDAVIFGDDKYHELIRQVTLDRVVAVADDLPEMLEFARLLGIDPRYIRHQPYNSQYPLAVRYDDNSELTARLLEGIDKWYETRV
jgi:hypothetical protein